MGLFCWIRERYVKEKKISRKCRFLHYPPCCTNLVYTNFYYAPNQILKHKSSEDANSDESIPEKKRQSVSNIRSINEANEIVEDTILITDRMFTERKEETAYNPIETELWVLLCSLSNEHAIFHFILYFFFLRTPNEKKETLINTHDEDIIDNIVLRDMYLDTRREIRDRISQKDASSPF